MNRNAASGPGPHTPDGCAVELYKVLEPRGEAEIAATTFAPGCSVLELGSGAGRVTHGLAARGYDVTAVDYSREMLAEIRDATVVCADIAHLDLRRTFGGVLLGSCLVNVAEDELRDAFLATCARHLEPRGSLLVERHDPSLLERARVGPIGADDNGVRFAWLDVAVSGSLLRGTLEYRYGSDVWTQTFSSRILTVDELKRAFARAGLTVVRSIGPNWIVGRVATST